MANITGSGIEYWLSLSTAYQKTVYKLRKWSHLKMAIDEHLIWIRGLTKADIESAGILEIPSIKRYYLKETHLIPFGKKLPALIEPNLIWSPIQRALKISLPKENFNYFGINQTYKISLVPSEEMRPVTATIVELKTLENYIHSALHFRLKNLKWTILKKEKAVIIGTPILPIQGQDLYENTCFLLPAGKKLQYSNMAKVYEAALGDSAEYWYLIDEHNSIQKLRKADFNRLSKGSFIKTFENI